MNDTNAPLLACYYCVYTVVWMDARIYTCNGDYCVNVYKIKRKYRRKCRQDDEIWC